MLRTYIVRVKRIPNNRLFRYIRSQTNSGKFFKYVFDPVHLEKRMEYMLLDGPTFPKDCEDDDILVLQDLILERLLDEDCDDEEI